MGAAATTPPRRAAILALLLASALSACVSEPGPGRVGGWDFALEDKPELWGTYRPQDVYELQQNVFLIDIPERTNGMALVPGMESKVPPGTVRGPTAISDYQANPKNWARITGVVPAGTLLRAEVLRGKGNLRDRELTVHYVVGRLLDSEFRGRKVDLHALSLYSADPDPDSRRVTLAGPNENFLTLAP